MRQMAYSTLPISSYISFTCPMTIVVGSDDYIFTIGLVIGNSSAHAYIFVPNPNPITRTSSSPRAPTVMGHVISIYEEMRSKLYAL